MDKNTENALINVIGKLNLSIDDMKKNFNAFGDKVLQKLDSIDSRLNEAIDLKQQIEENKKDIALIKRTAKD